MPDKATFGYGFPCDGPGRGGTCDISAWDGFYLAAFWMLNTIGWVTFYWHWKHITLLTDNISLWNESSTYLMGWLRDYLWFNSSQLINGYSPVGVTKNAVWDWMFQWHFPSSKLDLWGLPILQSVMFLPTDRLVCNAFIVILHVGSYAIRDPLTQLPDWDNLLTQLAHPDGLRPSNQLYFWDTFFA